MSEQGAEVTAAPEADLSLQATEMLLEDIASTVFGAEIEEIVEIHYDAMEAGMIIAHSVQCKSLDTAFRNAGQLSKSASILPKTIKVTSYKKITTPRTEHAIKEEPPQDAPKWKPPESHPYIPTD
jgi:hypothetical protein